MEKEISEAKKSFYIGTIGFITILLIWYIAYEIYPKYFEMGNPSIDEIEVNEPAFFGIGCLLLACMFFRMMISGGMELGLYG